MFDGKPSPDQLYKIIGSIYSDAYLRIEFLEKENKQLRDTQQTTLEGLRASMDSAIEENAALKKRLAKYEDNNSWKAGNETGTSQESLQENLESVLRGPRSS